MIFRFRFKLASSRQTSAACGSFCRTGDLVLSALHRHPHGSALSEPVFFVPSVLAQLGQSAQACALWESKMDNLHSGPF